MTTTMILADYMLRLPHRVEELLVEYNVKEQMAKCGDPAEHEKMVKLIEHMCWVCHCDGLESGLQVKVKP